ncbi:hypothetical protein FNV43_RR10719 [Rhamnella rubrinervis]|uniref:Dof zinc finger protein n=1 Tax=Rhamnella rubrinervis TaxID=2594499 RepID=A0A8K0H4W8_9ROSA|nr:hypothetical protein FNV43_RR10719 [Rhamnella rubrinervis]
MFTPFGDQVLQQCPPRQPLTTMMEKSWKPSIEIAPNCPRCASSNTKFCYYNNYSLSQPRYFCKGCRRYWTKGGSLRNVPVGGGCRKNRRGKSVRLPHREPPASLSSSQDSAEPSENSNGDSGGGGTSTGSSSSLSSYIDMAVVFAKFLNQEPGLTDHISPNEPSDSPSCLEPESVRNDKQSLVVEELVPGYDPQNEKIEEVLGINEIGSEFGLESFLDDHQHEVEQDVFWCDHEAASAHDHNAIPKFTWPPMVCMQELEAFPSDHDDHLRFSTNLMINDNWSSFDFFSGFEVFSRS